MRLVIVFLFISCSISSYSQKYIDFKTYDVDSLLLILPGQIGEERVNTLNFLSTSLSPDEFVSARQYAEEAMEVATELDFREGIAEAYRNFGHIYTFQSNYPEALNNYYESLRLYQDWLEE